jgi:hypothetical protein
MPGSRVSTAKAEIAPGGAMSKAEILDQQPPANLEAELAVLGSIILDRNHANDVFPILIAADFYDENNRSFFNCLQEMFRRGEGIDITTAVHRLREAGLYDKIGGAAYLANFNSSTPMATHAIYYAGIIREMSAKRRLRYLGERLLQESANGKAPEQSIADARCTLDAIKGATTGHNPTTIDFPSVSCRQLATTDYQEEYLIEDILCARQPCTIGGPRKGLKTWLIIDAALSLATGQPFLGKFPVLRGCRSGVMSGESQYSTLQKNARACAASKGYELDNIDGIVWSDKLPVFGSVAHVEGVSEWIPVSTERRLGLIRMRSGRLNKRFESLRIVKQTAAHSHDGNRAGARHSPQQAWRDTEGAGRVVQS